MKGGKDGRRQGSGQRARVRSEGYSHGCGLLSMVSWGTDDSKSILKYKQKDTSQESQGRQTQGRSTSQTVMEKKYTFINASCRPPETNSCLSPADKHKSLRL